MRKTMMLLAMMALCAGAAKAEDIRDLFKATLLDHVDLMTLYRLDQSEPESVRLAMVDSIVRFGSYKGASLIDIQGGFFGNTKPVEGEANVANWIGGIQVRIDPYLKGRIPFPAEWTFVNSIEHGPVVYRDFTNNDWVIRYAVGLSFGLEPNQP
jgi:hypothetical protein